MRSPDRILADGCLGVEQVSSSLQLPLRRQRLPGCVRRGQTACSGARVVIGFATNAGSRRATGPAVGSRPHKKHYRVYETSALAPLSGWPLSARPHQGRRQGTAQGGAVSGTEYLHLLEKTEKGSGRGSAGQRVDRTAGLERARSLGAAPRRRRPARRSPSSSRASHAATGLLRPPRPRYGLRGRNRPLHRAGSATPLAYVPVPLLPEGRVSGAELDATDLALVHASLRLAREATIQLEAVLTDELGGRRAM